MPQKEMLAEQVDHTQPATVKMRKSTLGVGIIGVSPVWGWAAAAHIPALRALPNYEIRALSAHPTSPTPSGATRSSPPSRGPRHQGNA